MRNSLTAILALLSVGLFSCQKEVDDIFKTNSGSNNTASLKRMVIKQGSDSSASDYFYDASGKIIAVNTITISSGSSEFNNEVVERNSQGMIQKIVTKASELSQFGVDSLVSVVNSTSGRYTNRVVQFNFLSLTVTFTTTYSYDDKGRIASQKDYIDDGAGNVDSSRMDYIYSGSNLVSLKGYDLNSGSSTPDLTQIFEYDTKSSPLVAGNDAFVLNNFVQWASANNITKMTTNVSGDPDTHVETWNYTYNSANNPLSANITQDGQTGIEVKYYYN